MSHEKNKAAKIGLIVGVVCMIGSGLFAYSNYQSFLDKQSQFQADVAEMQTNLTEIDSVDEQPMESSDAKEAVNSVKDIGDKIAGWQSDYIRLNHELNNCDVNSTQHDEIIDNTIAIADNFDQYFGKESSFRKFWFISNDQNVIPVWKFMTTYNFTGNKISVLWECLDDKGNLYAYTTGEYNVDSKSFSNLEKNVTTYGSLCNNGASTNLDGSLVYQESSALNNPEYANNVVSLFDTLGIAPEDYVEITDEFQENLDDIHSDQAALREAETGGN